MLLSLLPLLSTIILPARGQVTATNPNGATNPDKPSFYPVGSQVNQTSFSRLLSLNGVDDFCLWGPPEPGPDSLIGNTEPVVVAYCLKPRNGARWVQIRTSFMVHGADHDRRLIPDGAITAAHVHYPSPIIFTVLNAADVPQFIKTPLYVQIHGFWDGTKANIVRCLALLHLLSMLTPPQPAGDSGGELDPHGAENLGNPIGGNVTSNVPTGSDVFYEEWMSFVRPLSDLLLPVTCAAIC